MNTGLTGAAVVNFFRRIEQPREGTIGAGEHIGKFGGTSRTSNERILVDSYYELTPGDAVDAFYKDTLVRRGVASGGALAGRAAFKITATRAPIR